MIGSDEFLAINLWAAPCRLRVALPGKHDKPGKLTGSLVEIPVLHVNSLKDAATSFTVQQ